VPLVHWCHWCHFLLSGVLPLKRHQWSIDAAPATSMEH
jgi:hypothetical protein